LAAESACHCSLPELTALLLLLLLMLLQASTAPCQLLADKFTQSDDICSNTSNLNALF